MTDIRYDRLEILHDWMKTRVVPMPAESFAMGAWRELTGCGFVACLGGHAAMIPAFVEAGLSLCRGGTPVLCQHGGVQESGMQAMAVFFGLQRYQAQYLFASHGSSFAAGVPADRDDWNAANAVAHLRDFIDHWRTYHPTPGGA